MTRTTLVVMTIGATIGCVDDAPNIPPGNNSTSTNVTSNNATTANASTPNTTTNNATTNNVNNSNLPPWRLPDANRRVALEFTPEGFEGTVAPFNASIRFDTDTLDLPSTPGSARFVSADGQQLPHEVAIWNPQQAMVWISLPEVTARVPDSVWLYWHTEDEFGNDPQEVWAGRYSAVYHFEESELGFNSVTGNADLSCNGCTPDGGVSSRGLNASAGGLVGDLPPDMLVGADGKLTVSAWYRPEQGVDPVGPLVYSESFCAGWQTALVQTEESGDFTYAAFATDETIDPGVPGDICVEGAIRTVATTDLDVTPTAHHVVMVIDRVEDTFELYQDGTLRKSVMLLNGDAVSARDTYTPRFRIGTREESEGGTLVGATIDEVFVMPDAVSARWVEAHYSNLKTWGRATIASDVETQQ